MLDSQGGAATRALILDLDFTLLHLEAVAGAIEVPGRTRSAYVAPATVEALRDLQGRFAIVLATARSWDGARWVSDGLASRGVHVSACIVEDGALLRAPEALPLEAGRDWESVRADLDSRRRDSWPAFEWQRDFVACLVARAQSGEAAALLMQSWEPLLRHWNESGRALRMFRDGRKLYIAGESADKWAALGYLVGESALQAAGVGDGANDLCWLSRIALPCTMAHAAPQVLEAVRARGGFVSEREGHVGILEVLRFLEQRALAAGDLERA